MPRHQLSMWNQSGISINFSNLLNTFNPPRSNSLEAGSTIPSNDLTIQTRVCFD